MADTSWPAGDPDEANIRAELARKAEELPLPPTIRRSDIDGLDEIITFFDRIASFGLEGLYDDAWNLRNHLAPFQPGDRHYDSDGADEETRAKEHDGYTLATALDQAAAVLQSTGDLDLRDAVREAAKLLLSPEKRPAFDPEGGDLDSDLPF